nr:MAG TPA: hypothetical protein [Caudoviricetes sp.]
MPLFVNFCDETSEFVIFVAKNPVRGQKFLEKWPPKLT